MFEKDNQAVDGDELSEEDLTQIKATPHWEDDWQYATMTSVAHSQFIHSDHVQAGSFPESRAFFRHSLM